MVWLVRLVLVECLDWFGLRGWVCVIGDVIMWVGFFVCELLLCGCVKGDWYIVWRWCGCGFVCICCGLFDCDWKFLLCVG